MEKETGTLCTDEKPAAPADNGIMGWDDILENDGREFIVLPEGDYTYTVTGLERGQFPGGRKLPPCPKASLTLSIDNDEGEATARVDLMLCRAVEWKIAAFFRSIGLRRHGDRSAMNWDRVVGSRGRARFRPREYTKDGRTFRVNDLERFLDHDPSVDLIPVKDADLPWDDESA